MPGEFNRRGQVWRIVAATAIIITMEALLLGLKNLGEKEPWLTPLLYMTPVLPGLVGIYLLSPWYSARRRRLRTSAEKPVPQ